MSSLSSSYPSSTLSRRGTSSSDLSSNDSEPGASTSIGPPSQVETILKFWSFPKGKSVPAVVITMNHFAESNWTYIPCEIALSSFTIAKGIRESYCTIVDPGKMPMGCGIEGCNAAEKFGLPQPPFSKLFQDYNRIVNEIESFLLKSKVNDGDVEVLIFCLAEDCKKVERGMQWLYQKAGKKFKHLIFKLEYLLVVLSLGGLEHALDQQEKNEWGFEDIVKAFDMNAQAISSSTPGSLRSVSSRNSLKSVQDGITGSFSHISGISMQSYTSIGRSGSIRKAYKKKDLYPKAFLGIFTVEDEASNYLKQGDFNHLETLACVYHQGLVGFREQVSIPFVCGPRERLLHCALHKNRCQLYFALDVLIVNYGIEAKRGRHYPDESKPVPEEQSPDYGSSSGGITVTYTGNMAP